jgi:hypothetical protein
MNLSLTATNGLSQKKNTLEKIPAFYLGLGESQTFALPSDITVVVDES